MCLAVEALCLNLNKIQKKIGIYLRNGIKYTRRNDLEEEDFHIPIIDVVTHVKIRIVNVYRSFRPPNKMSPDKFFSEQLKIMSNVVCDNCIIMGDFNLDARMSNSPDYLRKVSNKCSE